MNWEQKYDALASMIEGYRHERNEALERLRLLEAEVERVNAREDATRRELAETRIDMRDMERERDEARAEVERMRVELIRAGSRECDIAACNCGTWHHQNPRAAYRRGAEAMRARCEEIARHACSVIGKLEHTYGIMTQGHIETVSRLILEVDIPEEPT